MKSGRVFFLVTGCVPVFLLMVAAGRETGPQQAPRADSFLPNSSALKMDTDFGRMPLYFIPNQGQMDKQVAYYVQGKDKTIYFTPGGITFALTEPAQKKEVPSRLSPARSIRELREGRSKTRAAGLKGVGKEPYRGAEGASSRWAVKLEFVGADKSVRPFGEAETGAVVSYFKGKPEEWHTGLPTYSNIIYPNLWPGIDLVYYGTVDRLKYEFIVHPGADPSQIRLAYRGAKSVAVDEAGRLRVETPLGGFSDDVPVAYQEKEGKRTEVGLSYRIKSKTSSEKRYDKIADQSSLEQRESATRPYLYGFEVGYYDVSLPLVLDPAILVYCGYIGGSNDDACTGIAVDGSGNAYVTGYTESTEATFPETVGPDLTYNGGSRDAFVAKVDSSGTALVYCGYIGGSSYDYGYGIAVDGSGNAYVTGYT